MASDQSLVAIRRQLIEKATVARQSMVQLLIEVARWNTEVRTPGEEPLVIDPDGTLFDCVDQLDELITMLGKSRDKTKGGI